MRPGYRIRQFWRALTAPHSTGAPPELSPGLQALFIAMPAADRGHALRTYRSLVAAGRPPQDLVAAALLHDVGKSGGQVHLWDRVAFVVASWLAPAWLARLGQATQPACWAGLVALQHHAERGAEQVAGAGGTPRVVALIRYHHADPATLGWPTSERQLLEALQRADSAS